jgi:nucleotide-binding universal stress UspA family protein
MFKHIAVGCDGSPEGRDAVALGAAIASVTGARLSLVGVFSPSWLPIMGTSDRRTLRAQATRALRRERDLLAPDASIHTIADASVARALRHYADRDHADLVIVGSSRRAAIGRVAIGRHGRQLLYDAPFSLGLAARDLHRQQFRVRAIGVGYDGGPEAEAALGAAAGLARAAGARLEVRSVVEDLVPVLSGDAWVALADWSHEQMWESARRKALADAQDASAELGVVTEVTATVGDPGYEMRALSEALDLVVVGSRRWGPVARLVTGGVGETLVRDAGCSILIVPRPPASRRRGTEGRAEREREPALA